MVSGKHVNAALLLCKVCRDDEFLLEHDIASDSFNAESSCQSDVHLLHSAARWPTNPSPPRFLQWRLASMNAAAILAQRAILQQLKSILGALKGTELSLSD